MMRKICGALAGAALLSVSIPQLVYAKTDVVEFDNGNRLVGEVKSLERGKLRFKTDATGTISIEWEDIDYLSSDQNIQTETADGTRYFGNLSRADDVKQIVVETNRGPIALDLERVVKMATIDQEGWRDWDIDVSAGYNFTSANAIRQFNVGASASHRTRSRIISADLSSVVSDSGETNTSQRQTLGFNFTKLRANRWLTSGNLTFDRNDELGLNLRTSLGAGLGRILTQSNNGFFVLEGGLKVTRENLINEPDDKDSLESYGNVQWDWFRFDSPELDWSTNLEISPSLTEWGRIRAEINTKLKWEIIGDLFWQFEIYNSYDSRPQTVGAANNDYGIITSLAYDF